MCLNWTCTIFINFFQKRRAALWFTWCFLLPQGARRLRSSCKKMIYLKTGCKFALTQHFASIHKSWNRNLIALLITCLYNVQCTAKTRYERDEPPYEAQTVIIIATMKFRCYIFKDSSRGFDVKCTWAIGSLKFVESFWFNIGGFGGNFGRYWVIKRSLLFCIFRIPFFALVVTQDQSKKNFWRTQLLDMHC